MKLSGLSIFVLFSCVVVLSACEPENDSESDTGTAIATDSGDEPGKDTDAGTGSDTGSLDPCETVQCDENATCEETQKGTAKCTCNKGFEGDGQSCKEVITPGPCETAKCDANATCSVDDGNAVCTCNKGFEGDGQSCKEVSPPGPCETAKCDANATCSVDDGNAVCTCNKGYEGDGQSCKEVSPPGPCETANCDANATCSVDDGNAVCTCNKGYEGDGQSCQEVVPPGPCETANCDEFASCSVGDDGNAVCTCNKGYEGDGYLCKASGNPCKGYADPACIAAGCPQGQVCVTDAECVSSMCVCDEKTGQPLCNDDCGGGVCVQNDKCQPMSCLLFCEDGFKENKDGCPICECVENTDVCANFDPNKNCGKAGKAGGDNSGGECQANCICDSKDGKVKCPEDPCGPGYCTQGSYCQGTGCINSKCYLPNHPMSLLMCQGALDLCCGEGECVGNSYCTGSECDDSLCYIESHPVSKLLCSKMALPDPQCGVGSCNKMGAYCDDCVCHLTSHPLSQALCGCDANSNEINTFQKVYGHYNGGDIAMAGVELADGGFVFAGWSSMATRTDKYGNAIWIKRYKFSFFTDVAATADTIYLLDSDGLIAINYNGDVQWTIKTDGHANSVAVASDGGVLFGGKRNNKFYIVKVDDNGNFLWGHGYGGAKEDNLNHIEPLSDGFLLVGMTKSFGATAGDYLVVRTDLAGVKQWAKRYGGPDKDGNDGNDISYSRAIQTSDNGFLLSGYTQGFGALAGDGLAIKLDAAGSVQWAIRKGGNSTDSWNAVAEQDDGYVLFGTSRRVVTPGSMAYPNIWLSKLSLQGNTVWDRVYGGKYIEGNYVDGGNTSDGGLFLIAHSHTYFVDGPGSKSHYLVKTDAEGLTPGCCNDIAASFDAVSPILAQQDVTLLVLGTSLAPYSPSLSLMVEDYQQASVNTVCEKTVGVLCDGISTGACDCSQ